MIIFMPEGSKQPPKPPSDSNQRTLKEARVGLLCEVYQGENKL